MTASVTFNALIRDWPTYVGDALGNQSVPVERFDHNDVGGAGLRVLVTGWEWTDVLDPVRNDIGALLPPVDGVHISSVHLVTSSDAAWGITLPPLGALDAAYTRQLLEREKSSDKSVDHGEQTQ